jgi:asparagine synthase (glutamine-hydrolysing)
MVSDVPVGIFLSGGYDSTAVTSILQSNRTKKLKTFTIGFHEGNNEAPYAQQIAKYLGTDHTEYYCETKEAQDIIACLPYYFDEPFADSSAIPTILVSKLAKRSVTVALSADAGDEIFAGYNNYKTFLDNLSFIGRIPLFSRKIISKLSKAAGANMVTDSFLKQKLLVLSDVLITDQKKIPQHLLKSYYSLNHDVKDRLFRYKASQSPSVYEEDFSCFKDSLSAALATDYLMYLQNDILTKVDRATMSVSLEGRDPFLDHRLVEFVAQLPSEFKFGNTQKMILKDIVYEYVPKDLLDRPKSGFSVPIISWFQNDLAYLVEEYLGPKAIARTDMFNYSFVQQLKQGLYNGNIFSPTIIWKLIQFQMWYNKWLI